MTDPTPPPTDDDLSTVLDGTADPALAARVEADAAARARLDALRGAVAAVREPVPPLDAATVDRLVATALDAADDGDGSTEGPAGAPGEDAVVAPLRPRRAAVAPPWLVAASIVALVAIGLALVWSGRDDGGTDQAGVTTSAEDGTSSGAGQVAEEESAPEGGAGGGGGGSDTSGERSDDADTTTASGAPEATTTPGAGDASFSPAPLGAYPTLEALRTALRDTFPAPEVAAGGTTLSTAQRSRCASLMRQVFDLPADPTRTGVATVDGEELLVYEFEAPSVRDGRPTTFVTVNDPASCNARLSFERDPS
ncbi:MAG TPA: hypothetical protein VHK88_01920 [Aquihabitans sp.]|jgi:hypothetical protein|nr:hypothetical protein [Aquihabitans sp.]